MGVAQNYPRSDVRVESLKEERNKAHTDENTTTFEKDKVEDWDKVEHTVGNDSIMIENSNIKMEDEIIVPFH